MAKHSSSPRRWARAITAHLFPCGGDSLWYALAILSIFSLLTHELSRRSALAADFEGFDFEEDEEEYTPQPKAFTSLPPSPPPTTLTQSSTPESHHGPPPVAADQVEPSEISQPVDPIAKPTPSASSVDEWDEDEFEGIPSQIPSQIPDPVAATPAASEEVVVKQKEEPKVFPRSYIMEIACVSFLISFAINYFTGKKQNENIALAWASKFATKDAIFEKNFSLLGTGDGKDTPLLLKEGQDVFKFYASGRRFCQGLLATMELKSRHDLISRIFDKVMPKKDTITFEVVMNDDAMDHVVFALARKKLAKSMHKEEGDLQRYASLVVTPPAGKKWVPEELLVVTESKEAAGDMLTDTVLDQVFGDKAFGKFGKGFISLHFSDQHPGSQKKILVFKFVLPDANNMADMTRLVALVPYYIDLIGRYKVSPQARNKTEAARAKAAQEAYRELQNVRQEELQKRKAEKKKLMEEAAAKLGAEAMRKREERDRAREVKKSMPRVKMLRSH